MRVIFLVLVVAIATRAQFTIPQRGSIASGLTVSGGDSWRQSTAAGPALTPIVQVCGNSTQHCTMSLTKTTLAGSDMALSLESFGSSTTIVIDSAYSCASLVSGTCDPSHSNVIDTFTLCSSPTCNIQNSGNDNIDAVYVAGGAGGANFVTVNSHTDPNLQPGFDYYFQEGVPPMCGGSLCGTSLDKVAKCTSQGGAQACTSTSITATDLMLGFLDTNNFVAAHNYQIEQTGNLFDINLTSAPAFTITTGGYWTTVHLYFKSNGLSFTPPTVIFSADIQISPPIANTFNSGALTCNLTCSVAIGQGAATSAGDLIFIHAYGNQTISSVSRSGVSETWTVPGVGSTLCGNTSVADMSCAYTLNSGASATFLSITMSGNCTCYFAVYSIKRSSGSFSVAGQASGGSVGTTNLTGKSLALSAGTYVCFAEFNWSTSTPTGIGTYLYPLPGGVNLMGGYGTTQPAGSMILLNAKDGTPPQMLLSSAAASSAAADICFQ